ncbi:hypothetical protein RRG08_038376 [Elysia crispata]|uniref:Uncharacterized protein n=1 Tax=Elysia crispata TaxID=231223 RepID=A0AAE1DTZ6_9GAST|nr:hypothetical protein RRG08_038376 [Elysia crispata]
MITFHSTGFDFTLESQHLDPSDDPTDRHVCSVLRCGDTLQDPTSDPANRTRTVTSLAISRIRLNGYGYRTGRWRELALVTPQQPSLNRVSDGIKVTGRLSDQQATIVVEFAKTNDCQDSQFSCVAVYVDSMGQTSVKKSLVGKGVDSSDFGSHVQPDIFPVPAQRQPNAGDPGSEPGILWQQVNSIQMKMDWVGSRLEDSLNALENRLEDKIGQLKDVVDGRTDRLDSSMEGRFRALNSRIDNLEDRLEDRITQSHSRVLQKLRQMEPSCPDTGDECHQLTSQVDDLVDKLDTSLGTLDTCLAEVHRLNGSTSKHEVQCVATEDSKLTNLTSDVAKLSGLTHTVLSQVNSLRDGYGSGALVPVDEFFDPLNTGKKEWRLAFRGTAFNNVRVYPAYMHGTGIPAEVEEGCKQFNRSLPCVNHYRNRDVFNNWAGIDEVLFAIYKDGQMVKKVVFNGKGSTFTSWFAANRVILSSWSDLTTQPHNFFRISGDNDTGGFRRFFMNRDYDRSCDNYRGWFKATETDQGCLDEKNTIAIPKFQYAPGNTFTLWSSAAVADAFGIFLRYE